MNSFSRRFLVLVILTLLLGFFSAWIRPAYSQDRAPVFEYRISIPQPGSHRYHVSLETSGWDQDTLRFKMPAWMPGYYQPMHYAKGVDNFLVKDGQGNPLPIRQINENSWQLTGSKGKQLAVSYDIRTERQFVAYSYVDSNHAYLIPENSFLYVEGALGAAVSVMIELPASWKNIATGLEPVPGKQGAFHAPDFDILYDCPILLGNLEELPSFKVRGIEHRFIGYQMGEFDRAGFMKQLKKVVEVAVDMIGDIPYKQYTFIGIGPGRGGIEHLNNTTVSFDGRQLTTPEAINRTLNFLAHEYFHHYNVKRIRPFELGPFDYDNGSRTNLLWVSEGLSVYYEYILVRRAGLSTEKEFLANFERDINALEKNPGRRYQSLVQASYDTWQDGPFGTSGQEAGKTISYYQKGPVVGMLLDFAIRSATRNEHSLDDVMVLLYQKYYKQLGRGFTDAEFQQACESVAGIPLAAFFEYVYTTRDLDYNAYLNPVGLSLKLEAPAYEGEARELKNFLAPIGNPSPLQTAILNSWKRGDERRH